MLFRLASGAEATFSRAMDVLLSQLYCAASGRTLASENPGAAIHEAFLPLLSDSVLHLPEDESRVVRWRGAMPIAVAQERLRKSVSREASINTALNVVHSNTQAGMTARERGAVYRVTSEEFSVMFPNRTPDALQKDFALRADIENKKWVAIQVEAVCDYAQQKSV